MARYNRYVYDEDSAEEYPRPTEEVSDYLKLRNRLKEEKRKMLKEELGTGKEEKNLSTIRPKDNYGNFFGPSQTVIAERVKEAMKSLTKNPNPAAGVMKSVKIIKKSFMAGASVGSELEANVEKPELAINMLQKKVQILKYSRDYSLLLSDDAEVPDPSKDPPKSEITTLSNKGGKVFVGEEDKKPPAAATGRFRPTVANQRSAESIHKHSRTLPVVTRKIISSSNRTFAADHPKTQRRHSSSNNGSLQQQRRVVSKDVPIKINQSGTSHKKETSSVQKPAPVKKQMRPPPPKPKALISQSEIQPPPRNSVRERPLDNRQEKKRRRHNNNNNNNDDIDTDDPIGEIRKLLRYNPRKYADYEDDDDSNMVANFDDIMREEKRSAKIGRKEDEEEFRKLEKERKERLKKKAKK